jgi:hypothetical protein
MNIKIYSSSVLQAEKVLNNDGIDHIFEKQSNHDAD